MRFQSLNPATGQVLEYIDAHDDAEVLSRLTKAREAFTHWRWTGFAERGERMLASAAVLDEDRERFARAMTLEMGKPIAQARAEVEKCAWVCRYYAGQAESMLRDEAAESDGSAAWVRFDPLGPVLAVMPWNFPFWQVFRFAAPALMAGNVGLLKHASNVPRCALMIEEVFTRAGFPEGCFSTLLISSTEVAAVIADPVVAAVTLTGSEPAGMNVAATAGRHLKKTVLELGGSDPFIVLRDADVDRAARVAATARMINTGQSCIAAKRFIVEDAVYERFAEGFVAAVRGLRVGDPLDDATEVGAMAREDLLLELHAQVQRSVEMGARVLTGGQRSDGPGAFYLPTVMDQLTADMPVWREETFGPVAALWRVGDVEEALRMANDTDFGLGASVWTADADLARYCAAHIEAGSVFINGMVKSDPRLPFGGIGKSGYGRELSSFGIREFVNIKSVWMA